ncbi:hypothetical protein H4R20_007007, partial [Coemansia guatemalensis]
MPDAPHCAAGPGPDIAAAGQDTGAIRTSTGYSEQQHDVGDVGLEEEEEVIDGGRVAGSTVTPGELATTNDTGPDTVQTKDKDYAKDGLQTPPALPASPFEQSGLGRAPQSGEIIQAGECGASVLSNGNVPAFDDSLAVSSFADYSAVSREAYTYWRARLKQPGRLLEQ